MSVDLAMVNGVGRLRLSGDRKVSPLVRGKYGKDDGQLKGATVRIHNSFGLPSGSDYSCCDATSVCDGVCYAGKLETIYRGLRDLLVSNYETLLSVGDDVGAIVDLLADLVYQFRRQARAQAERFGLDWEDVNIFRIHWDGDFYSTAYAEAWAIVIAMFPDVRFWAYSRSFVSIDIVGILGGLDNLSLYLSVDSDNVGEAVAALSGANGDNVKVASLGETFDDAQSLLVELDRRRAPKCPEVNGPKGKSKALLIAPRDGRPTEPLLKGDNGEGACAKCGLCVDGRADVLFSIGRK